MKKVLYYHPLRGPNLGDDVTFNGAVQLLEKAIGKHEITTYYTENPENVPTDEVKKTDMLVLAGTPWLWDRCEESPKYQAFNKIVDAFKNKPKLALGIGNGYPLKYIPPENKDVAEVWKKFDFIATRDSIASGMLTSAGIDNLYTFCTSAYAPIYEKKGISINEESRPTVVFYDPAIGLAKSVLPVQFCEIYKDYMHRIIRKYNAKVMVISQEEKDGLLVHGIEAYLPKNIWDITDYLYGSRFVLSGRVHSAIPSAMLGIPTYIMPIDSRWYTTIPFGVVGLTEEMYYGDANLHSFRPIDFFATLAREKFKLIQLLSRFA